MVGQEIRNKVFEAFSKDEFDEHSLRIYLDNINGISREECEELIGELKRYHQVLSNHQRNDVLRHFDNNSSIED